MGYATLTHPTFNSTTYFLLSVMCGNVDIDTPQHLTCKEILMNRSKLVAIITGAISILLAIAYLILVQLLDYRDMKPAPISQVMSQQAVGTTVIRE
jgi:hypothetical protein